MGIYNGQRQAVVWHHVYSHTSVNLITHEKYAKHSYIFGTRCVCITWVILVTLEIKVVCSL